VWECALHLGVGLAILPVFIFFELEYCKRRLMLHGNEAGLASLLL
jgi:hypothetical protein